MKCPYNVKWQVTTQSAFEHDENGLNTKSGSFETQKPIMPDCIQENCAAFQDGRCRYNG